MLLPTAHAAQNQQSSSRPIVTITLFRSDDFLQFSIHFLSSLLCTILRPQDMTPRIACDSKESHDRSAWSTCSAEIPGTILH